MNIVFIGTGYVGLVSGTCFAELGWNVTCLDNNGKKIAALEQGEVPIFEPGLGELIEKNRKAGRLHFSTETAKHIPEADVVFIAVGTPTSAKTGEADLSFVFAVAEEIAPLIKNGAVIVTKSTVPVGTGQRICGILEEKVPDTLYDVVSNPEFLREGCAVKDFLEPDRIVVGVSSEKAQGVMQNIYAPLMDKGVELLCTDLQTSELIKYAANAFLATKIAFINEAADMCEHVGADVKDLARGIGLDHRIGNTYLSPGPGYGGSCFPKDTLALQFMAKQWGVGEKLVSATIASNDERKKRMVERVIAEAPAKGTIAFLGLAFKANTDDVRESPALAIARMLLDKGFYLRCYDPEAMEEAKAELRGYDELKLDWCDSCEEALTRSDIAVVATEWSEFAELDLDKFKELIKTSTIVDFRNMFDPADMQKLGIRYISIGREVATTQA